MRRAYNLCRPQLLHFLMKDGKTMEAILMGNLFFLLKTNTSYTIFQPYIVAKFQLLFIHKARQILRFFKKIFTASYGKVLHLYCSQVVAREVML